MRTTTGLFVGALLSAVSLFTVSGTAAAAPATAETPGNPTVGALFIGDGVTPTALGHWCTGTVINTPKRDIVLTAAHCVSYHGVHTNVDMFIPGYSVHNSNKEPYGKWPVKSVHVDPKWGIVKQNPDHDVALLVIDKNGGRNVQDVVGAQDYRLNAPIGGTINTIGYPHADDFPLLCTNTASTQTDSGHADSYKVDCGKQFGDGVSGSALLADFDSGTGHGTVVAEVGGYHEGGNSDETYIYGHRLDNDFAAFLSNTLAGA